MWALAGVTDSSGFLLPQLPSHSTIVHSTVRAVTASVGNMWALTGVTDSSGFLLPQLPSHSTIVHSTVRAVTASVGNMWALAGVTDSSGFLLPLLPSHSTIVHSTVRAVTASVGNMWALAGVTDSSVLLLPPPFSHTTIVHSCCCFVCGILRWLEPTLGSGKTDMALGNLMDVCRSGASPTANVEILGQVLAIVDIWACLPTGEAGSELVSPFSNGDITEIDLLISSSWISTGGGPSSQPYPFRISCHSENSAKVLLGLELSHVVRVAAHKRERKGAVMKLNVAAGAWEQDIRARTIRYGTSSVITVAGAARRVALYHIYSPLLLGITKIVL
ncbi:hypothetical protein J6590_003891 [Homalodisca vitripennis]|nr:hypothetical protein J6590_003891 [Homalodisca vitripennis]